MLDTGCGEHPWFTFTDRDGDLVRLVDEAVDIDGTQIGFGAAPHPPDPEVGGDFDGPIDGLIDPLSGHGTFICGLIHQQCPDADLIAWRVVPSAGFIPEGDLIDALVAIATLAQRFALGAEDGQRIDVLNLSLGFYHETPQDALVVGPLLDALTVLANAGTAVVCAAGNDATARPVFPAAFAPQLQGNSGVPMCSVGALNPNESSIALFSNTGDWVTHYEVGASVLSTMPAFEGGIMPVARTGSPWGLRESVDSDDFSTGRNPDHRDGGFALWSGTSFAAPVLAGRIASAIIAQQAADGDDRSGQLGRVRRAVAELDGS